MRELNELVRKLNVQAKDNVTFQRPLRVLQALWREERGYPMGTSDDADTGRPLGSRLPEDWAEQTLAAFLDERIREVVRHEIQNKKCRASRLFKTPRIYNNLLSSQPMAVNLFAIPSRDLDLATRWFRRLLGDAELSVTRIELEWSPGRRDPRFTGDKSAFDIFVEYTDGHGAKAFVGIEVKYHENLRDEEAELKDRSEELTVNCGWFRMDRVDELEVRPLEQIWRDHLIAAALLDNELYKHGKFFYLYPAINTACRDAVVSYRDCLADDSTFGEWTLEHVVKELREVTDQQWVRDFDDRYLNYSKVEAAMAAL
jgi:hypothetical protein